MEEIGSAETEASTPLTHFKPETAYSPEKPGSQNIEIVADPVSGKILKSGDPRDVRQWVEGQKSRAELEGLKPPGFTEVHGGLLIPGLVDAHAHPFLYSGLELDKPANVSSIETKEELISQLRERAKTTEKDRFLLAAGLDTTKIKDLTADDLDKVSQEHKVVVYDPSYHGCVVNSRTLAEIERYGTEYQEKAKVRLRGLKLPNGHLKEDWVYMTWELIEAEGGVKRLAEVTQKELETSLTRGVTALHDLELGTYNDFVAWLMLRQKLGERLPVRQVYLQPRTLKYALSQIQDLRERGLVSHEDEILKLAKAGVLGIKVYSDGSFGAHTALLHEPYEDTGTKGLVFYRMEQLNQALALAKKYGIENVAVHAIGDRGIQRAVEMAKKWARMAEKGDFDPTKFRIEHFEMPAKETLKEVADLGIWVTPQANFLTDYAYHDRLGDRVKMICPHREIVNRGIPMMFGTDGMPSSALFAIWMATHAPEESQRLTFDEALLAFSLASGRYEGVKRGTLETGQKADIIVADPKLLDQLVSSEKVEHPGEVPMATLIPALEQNIQKVYLRGQLIHSK